MQRYTRLYDYIHEYQHLVYDYYSKHGIAFLTTYYNINTKVTVWENEDLMGGAYEEVGDLTGIKFNKILLLPVYFIEEITTPFDAQDIGYIKENETNIVIPYSYGITPYPRDLVKLEQEYLRPTNDTYPTFVITGAEISTNTDKRFWKLKLEIFQSKTTTQIEQQVEETQVFFDYDKKIHTLADSESLTKLLTKNETLRGTLKNLYDENSGFYLC